MVIATSGTFDYTFVVPTGSRVGTGQYAGCLREPIEGDPDASSGTHRSSRRSSITGEAVALSNHLDRDREATRDSIIVLVHCGSRADRNASGNDVLHIGRTPCAGLGYRFSETESWCGRRAVMHVPLGPTVSVRYPRELIEKAEAIFRARDPEYDMRNYPVELRVGDVFASFTKAGQPWATTKSSFDMGTLGHARDGRMRVD